MVVDVTNLDSSQHISLRLKSSNSYYINDKNKKVHQSTNLDSDIELIDNRKDTLNINSQAKKRLNFKNAIEANNFKNLIDDTFYQIENRLKTLKQTAENYTSDNLSNEKRYQTQMEFEKFKNSFNDFVDNLTFRNSNLIQNLYKEGYTFKMNDKEPINIKLKKENTLINGFNSESYKFENLNISNQEEAQQAIQSIDQAINKVSEDKNELNTTTTDFTQDLLNLLKNSYLNSELQADNVNTEIQYINNLVQQDTQSADNYFENLDPATYLSLIENN